MALQLSPLLYNTRYASYFIAPFTILLCALSVAYVIGGTGLCSGWPAWRRWAVRLGWAAAVVWLAYVLTQHAVRREVWQIDATRPGPTAIVLPAASFGSVAGDGLTRTDDGTWVIDSSPATLHVDLDARGVPGAEQMRDAVWRLRFGAALGVGKPSSDCLKVEISVIPHQSEISWYQPPSQLFLGTDGKVRDYMISADGVLRPSGRARFALKFRCPAGTLVDWQGIELRRLALGEAARDFFMHATPIDPYLHSPLQLP